MADAGQTPPLRRFEDVAILIAAALLAVYVFTDRSAAWTAMMVVAVVVMAAIFVRRLVGWARARRSDKDG